MYHLAKRVLPALFWIITNRIIVNNLTIYLGTEKWNLILVSLQYSLLLIQIQLFTFTKLFIFDDLDLTVQCAVTSFGDAFPLIDLNGISTG